MNQLGVRLVLCGKVVPPPPTLLSTAVSSSNVQYTTTLQSYLAIPFNTTYYTYSIVSEQMYYLMALNRQTISIHQNYWSMLITGFLSPSSTKNHTHVLHKVIQSLFFQHLDYRLTDTETTKYTKEWITIVSSHGALKKAKQRSCKNM